MKYSTGQRVLPISLGQPTPQHAAETVIFIAEPQPDGSVGLTTLPACGCTSTHQIPATEAALLRAILKLEALPNKAWRAKACLAPLP